MKLLLTLTRILGVLIALHASTAFGIANGWPDYDPAIGVVEPLTLSNVGRCTGTLVAPRLVLTTAHCFCKTKFSYCDKDNINVRAKFILFEHDPLRVQDMICSEYLSASACMSGGTC